MCRSSSLDRDRSREGTFVAVGGVSATRNLLPPRRPTATVEKLDEYRELREKVREVGEERAEETRDLYEKIDAAFEEYREDATGHGEFGRYVEFQNVVIAAENRLEASDVYRADDFEKALSRLDARTLRDKHFRRARGDLEEIAGFVGEYKSYVELRDALKEELSQKERRVDELEDEIRESERRLDTARRGEEVDASPLREAVERYNERVREEFEAFLRKASAVEVARLGEKTLDAPLVDDAPIERGTAERLSRHVDDEAVERVLELADSSDAKLSHYVDNTDGFRAAVPRTFFETADAERFELGYEREGVMRRLVPELVRIVSRFADEETVAALRRVGGMAERGEYGPMRRALEAREDAGADSEEIAEKIDGLRDEKERLEKETENIRGALQE